MGRPAGAMNKMGAQAKQELAQAFFDLGGRKALVRFAGKNPEAFYKIWAKLIPNDARIELAVTHTVVRNFTGKAAEALPVIQGEARVVEELPTPSVITDELVGVPTQFDDVSVYDVSPETEDNDHG